MATEAELRKGEEAKRLLDGELFQSIFDDMRQEQLANIENSLSGETDIREHCYRMLQTIDLLRGRLEAMAGAVDHQRSRDEKLQLMR